MNRTRKIAEYRAEVKGLMEQRAEYQEQMEKLLKDAKAETRALTDEEQTTFDDLEKKIKDIDVTIEAEERAIALVATKNDSKKDEGEEGAELRAEENEFCDFIRGTLTEARADVNMQLTDNGAVIPTTIVNKIIDRVKAMSPIYEKASKYFATGNLSIPYVDEETGTITMAYASEFTELESSATNLKSVDLSGHLAGVLSKISKSLLKNSNFDLLNFVVEKMAYEIRVWLEGELLNGTEGKIEGVSGAKQTVTAAAQTAVTSDELIDLQEMIPDNFQGECIWIMSRATRTAIRKLKDKDGNYILNKDATAKWGYRLFNNDVYTSDSMSDMAAGKTAIVYGDMSGLAVKISEDVNIEVLREKYATQHAIGVVGWMEVDSKVENQQKLAKLVMAQ